MGNAGILYTILAILLVESFIQNVIGYQIFKWVKKSQADIVELDAEKSDASTTRKNRANLTKMVIEMSTCLKEAKEQNSIQHEAFMTRLGITETDLHEYIKQNRTMIQSLGMHWDGNEDNI